MILVVVVVARPEERPRHGGHGITSLVTLLLTFNFPIVDAPDHRGKRSLPVLDRFFVLSQLRVDVGSGQKGLHVPRVKGDGLVQVRKGVVKLTQLRIC